MKPSVETWRSTATSKSAIFIAAIGSRVWLPLFEPCVAVAVAVAVVVAPTFELELVVGLWW